MRLPVIHVLAALLLCLPLAAEQAPFQRVTAVQINSQVIISILSSSAYQSERVTMSIFVGPKSDGGGPPVTGTITVRDGETIIFTGPYNSREQRFMYRLPIAGLHTFTCAYSGDANYLPGTGTLSQLVTRATAFVSLFSDPDSPLLAGQSLTLQAAVIAAGGVLINSNGGPVTFYDNGYAIGTAATVGCCTSFTFQPSLGRHSYSATYNGNADLDPSPMSFPLDYTVYSLPCSAQATCGRRRAVGH